MGYSLREIEMLSHRRAAIFVYSLIVLFFVYDLYDDLTKESLDISFVIEAILFGLIATLLFYDIRILYQTRTQYQDERAHRLRLSGKLRDFIEERFNRWRLSPSEGEIAWFLLHGYSFQEIAESRDTKEKTVRQQASSIYSKSETANRSEFVALFLEDIMAAAHQTT